MRLSLAAGLAAVAVAFSGAASAEEWTKKFELAGKPELRVTSDDAAVRVSAGDIRWIEARVVTQGWKIAPGEVRVTDRQSGNRVEIEVRVPQVNWNIGRRSVRIELMVPREIDSVIRTGDGSISVRSLKGDTRLTTGDGGIDADLMDGALEARSGDGSIHIAGRFDELALRTGDGSIDASVKPGSRMASAWRVHTGDGSVRLRLPDGFAADLDVRTGDGRISVDVPVTTSGQAGGTAVRGKLNGGGPPLTVRTNDGSIHIERW